jgi:hypothetical protein
MIKLTDSSGNLFPAVRNLLNLVWLTVGIFLGWGGHIVWNRQAESDQLVDDAKEMVIIRKDKQEAKEVLKANVKEAKKLKSDDCLHSKHEQFVNELRKGRETGFEFDGRHSF